MNMKLFSTLLCSNFPSCPSKLLYSCLKKKKSGVKNQILLLIDTAPLNLSLYFLAMCAILLPQPRTEPSPSAVEVQCSNHWTCREVPLSLF